MKKNCFILLDTNICIYRTLAYVEPRILKRELLDKVTDKIDILTNNNLACKIIITTTIINELRNQEILFWEISQFCMNNLHHKSGDYKTLRIFEKAKKSINKFLIKYQIGKELIRILGDSRLDLTEINNFYLNYPEKLNKITQNKVMKLKQFQKDKKLRERPNNLPEENDRILLSEAIKINNSNENDVYIFSNDNDFIEFVEEIKTKFNVKILKLFDSIEEEDS